MFLILFIMHDPDLLEELIMTWQEEGVQGATVVLSTGMGRIRQKETVRDDIPLLPSLADFYEAPETLSRTVFTAVKDESMIDKILAATQRVVGDLNRSDTGIFLVLPILRAHGLEKGKKP